MEFGYEKVPNWKTLFGYRPDVMPIPYNSSSKDKYEALSIKLQATRMAGQGFVELLEILANYQRSRTKPVRKGASVTHCEATDDGCRIPA